MGSIFLSFQAPTVVCHHLDIPLSMILFFHNLNVLMELFALVIT